jgi:hypothetical protein
MTTLPDRPNTALMVLDMQKGVVAEAHQRDAVVSNIAALVDRAREAGGSGHLGPAFRRPAGAGERGLGVRARAGTPRAGTGGA